ncbi:MAG: FlgD immunoglobulin-like domain containing protein, partial [candidate division WOR-3 bacterium]
IPIATKVKVTIFNATGDEIAVLVNCLQKPGLYSVIWSGRDNTEQICPNGLYFYRLETKEFQNTKKMLLLR